MGRLFGTDGVRGIANKELSCETAMNIGRATAIVLTKQSSSTPKILIGKDTRISSDMLECALVAGICSVGADAIMLGEVPTPAVAYLVRHYKADAGIMISASHNPAEYNGIKLFSGEGYKLPDETEEKIEELILDRPHDMELKVGNALGKSLRSKTSIGDYISYTSDVAFCGLSGVRVAIDCANGSASTTAKRLFESLGADCIMLNSTPNGININDNCGSTHMDDLCKTVKKNKCDIGIAFDGDADRCLAVDENGELVDGDMIIAILSNYLKNAGRLHKDSVVVTVMSNLGFFKFAENEDITSVKTKVGDRYVLEEMLKSGYNLGGEQSGHIIFLDHGTTGDGQMTAVLLLCILKSSGKKMSELASVMQRYPQVLTNIHADDEAKQKYDLNDEIPKIIEEYEKKLKGDGRILIRPSGTEPLIRVMIEGKDFDEISRMAHKLSAEIKERIR